MVEASSTAAIGFKEYLLTLLDNWCQNIQQKFKDSDQAVQDMFSMITQVDTKVAANSSEIIDLRAADENMKSEITELGRNESNHRKGMEEKITETVQKIDEKVQALNADMLRILQNEAALNKKLMDH